MPNFEEMKPMLDKFFRFVDGVGAVSYFSSSLIIFLNTDHSWLNLPALLAGITYGVAGVASAFDYSAALRNWLFFIGSIGLDFGAIQEQLDNDEITTEVLLIACFFFTMGSITAILPQLRALTRRNSDLEKPYTSEDKWHRRYIAATRKSYAVGSPFFWLDACLNFHKKDEVVGWLGIVTGLCYTLSNIYALCCYRIEVKTLTNDSNRDRSSQRLLH